MTVVRKKDFEICNDGVIEAVGKRRRLVSLIPMADGSMKVAIYENREAFEPLAEEELPPDITAQVVTAIFIR